MIFWHCIRVLYKGGKSLDVVVLLALVEARDLVDGGLVGGGVVAGDEHAGGHPHPGGVDVELLELRDLDRRGRGLFVLSHSLNQIGIET